MDGNLLIPELLILVLGGSLYKFDAMHVAGMAMLYKRLAVIHAMAEGVCPILLHRLVRLLMSLGGWLMLLVAGEEAVRCRGYLKGLQRFAVHHVMEQEINNKTSDAINAMVVVRCIGNTEGVCVCLS